MTPSITNNGQDTLDVCREIRLECAALYHHYAEVFKGNRRSLLLWKRMALEAENHASKFSLMAKLRRQKFIGSLRTGLIEAEIALIYVQSLLKRATSKAPDMEEAIKSAVDLEEKLSPFSIDSILLFVDETCSSFFRAMARPNTERTESLLAAYRLMTEAPTAAEALPHAHHLVGRDVRLTPAPS